MASSVLRRYTGQGLKPHMVPKATVMDAVGKMWPGVYAAGTVLGQNGTWTAANDVQTVTVTGAPSGGSFYLSFGGVFIGPVVFNSTAAQLQAILDAASNIGVGQTVVTGGPFPGTPLVVTFSGTLVAGQYQPLMLVGPNSLTGGASPAYSVAHTTDGRSLGGIWGPYNDALSNGMEVARALLANATVVDTYGQIQTGGGQWGEKSYTASVYIGGYFRTADCTGLDAAGVADLGKLVYGTTSILSNTGTVLYIR